MGFAVARTAEKLHVLIINDAQELLEVMQDLLEEEGYRVSVYSHAVRDLAEIAEIGPDLVILDHMMGDEEYGWQLVQKIRLNREMRDLPIIVCTAALKMVQELEGHLKAKRVTVVLKPFDIDDLLAAVEATIAEAASA